MTWKKDKIIIIIYFFYHKIASCSCWCSRCLLFYVHDHARYCVLLKQAREADEMTCRSYFPLFDVAVLFPLFYYNSKKKTLSFSRASTVFVLCFLFFLLYSHHILCRQRSLLRSIHNSFETKKERNALANKKKLRKKSGMQNAFSACLLSLCNMLSDHYRMRFFFFFSLSL